jgi:hypothetical protein
MILDVLEAAARRRITIPLRAGPSCAVDYSFPSSNRETRGPIQMRYVAFESYFDKKCRCGAGQE